VVAGSSNSFW